jgi:hypothetical protein
MPLFRKLVEDNRQVRVAGIVEGYAQGKVLHSRKGVIPLRILFLFLCHPHQEFHAKRPRRKEVRENVCFRLQVLSFRLNKARP